MFSIFTPKGQSAPSFYPGHGVWVHCAECQTSHPMAENPDLATMIDEASDEVAATSQEIYDEFGICEPGGRWQTIPERALFKFILADGRTCFARYGAIASWAEDSHNWLWSWAMPEDWVPTNAQAVARRVQEFGARQDWSVLTSNLLADENATWGLTKLSAHLVGMPMVYRARVNAKNWHYFAMSRPFWAA